MKNVRVVHAIIKRDGRFLLGKRSLSKKQYPGHWASIGGKLEVGESPEAGLIRECFEEIDVLVKPIRQIKEIHDSQAIHTWYEVVIVSGNPSLANDEHSELRWCTISEIEQLFPIAPDDLEIARSL
jgi:8-oxo-dGTP pyrophosphatase MutT (NUDIX family)